MSQHNNSDDPRIEIDVDEARTFSSLLARMEEGQLDRDLTEVLSEMVRRLVDIERDRGGRPVGEITLKLKLKLDDGMFETRTEYKIAMPKETRSRSLFYATARNTLTGRNPRQRALPFGVRDITAGPATVRDVTA